MDTDSTDSTLAPRDPAGPWNPRKTLEAATTAVDMESLTRNGIGSLRVVSESRLVEILEDIVEDIVEESVQKLRQPSEPSEPPLLGDVREDVTEEATDEAAPPLEESPTGEQHRERFERLEGLATQLSSMSSRLQSTLTRLDSPTPSPSVASNASVDIESRRRLLIRQMLLGPLPQ